MNTPKISIIIVVYNAAEMLRRTLCNVVRLRYVDAEIIVVDGASKDGTVAVIREFEERITRWVSEPDGGIYDAMNKGLGMATGDYIWYVNAGDTIYDECVFEGVFDSDWADVYYGETMMVSPAGEQLGLRKKKVPENLSWKSLKNGMVICHQSFIVRREIAPTYNLDYKIAADVEWELLCLKAARTTHNLHRIVSVFETGGVSTSRRKAALVERFKIMRKYFGLVTTIAVHVKFLFKNVNDTIKNRIK